MPRTIDCKLSTDELRKAYLEEGRTIREMCPLIGCKSTITAAKILTARGISTDNNARRAEKSMNGMTDEEFRSYLEREYAEGHSMNEIARKVGITPSGVRKYFVKYGIERRSTTAFLEGSPTENPNWHGGRRKKDNGYIEIYCPDHPNANKRKCVYEHQLVMEAYIGRYIKKGEVVHHIDGNKHNNDISNLLLLSSTDHTKLHAILRRSAALMNGGGDRRV